MAVPAVLRLALSVGLWAVSGFLATICGVYLFLWALFDGLALPKSPDRAKFWLAWWASAAISALLSFGAVRAWDWFRRYCWRHRRDGCGVCRARAELGAPLISDADRLQAWRERSAERQSARPK